MSTAGVSPKAALRMSLRSVYRARGHRVANLWAVYSVKTDRDWLLPSDRQLIHWLYYLETNPEVYSFDLAPDPVVSHDENEARATELDASVVFRDGRIEWHEVKASTSPQENERSQHQAQSFATEREGVGYRRFSDTDFAGLPAMVSLRWLKPIAYAEVIRGQECGPYRTALAAYCSDQRSGTLVDLVRALENFDTPTLLGVLTRFAIGNIISLDLRQAPFGPYTRWSSNDRGCA